MILGLYASRGEKSRDKPDWSWSNVSGPQFRGSALDVEENLEKELGEGKHQK